VAWQLLLYESSPIDKSNKNLGKKILHGSQDGPKWLQSCGGEKPRVGEGTGIDSGRGGDRRKEEGHARAHECHFRGSL